jgi:hypothetical protein
VLFFFLINLKKSHDWLFLLLYISYEAVIYFFLETQPILRFFYILLITSGLILVAIYAQKIKLSLSQVFYSILTVNLISALYIFYQSHHSELSIRPSALFMEPSYAGLSLYSVVSGLIGVFLFCNKESFSITAYLGSIALLMVAGILTLSFHFVALFISVSLFFILRLASGKHYHVGYLLGPPILFVFIFFTVREFDFFMAHFNSVVSG